MSTKQLTFGQKAARVIMTAAIPALMVFGCKKPAQEPLSTNAVVGQLQMDSRNACKLNDRAVRFSDSLGTRYVVRDGDVKGDGFGGQIRLSVLPTSPRDGTIFVRIVEPNGTPHGIVVRRGCI